MIECPECKTPIAEDCIFCKHCRSSLCRYCGRWSKVKSNPVCTYCGKNMADFPDEADAKRRHPHPTT